jgi:sterol desaturase/sphingolipid hydroxylase (fatty acid hydroxylase superfamily)
MGFNEFVLTNELPIRLGFFFGVFTAMALWEIAEPRRHSRTSRAVRRANNPGLVFLNSFVLRLAFPAAAVGMALDFFIWLQHAMVHAIAVLWRLHRAHHSVEDNETNSNFGFNLPWWDRLYGTCRAQPRGGHEAMTIGIHTFCTDRWCSWLPGILAIPFIGKVQGCAINRRQC